MSNWLNLQIYFEDPWGILALVGLGAACFYISKRSYAVGDRRSGAGVVVLPFGVENHHQP